MYIGTLLSQYIRSNGYFIANADSFDVYSGYSVIIPTAQLFKNDIDSDNAIPFVLLGIYDIIGGVAIIERYKYKIY